MTKRKKKLKKVRKSIQVSTIEKKMIKSVEIQNAQNRNHIQDLDRIQARDISKDQGRDHIKKIKSLVN